MQRGGTTSCRTCGPTRCCTSPSHRPRSVTPTCTSRCACKPRLRTLLRTQPEEGQLDLNNTQTQVGHFPNITSYVAKNTSTLQVSTINFAVSCQSVSSRSSLHVPRLLNEDGVPQYNPTSSVPPVYVGVFGFSTTSFKLAAQGISTVFQSLLLATIRFMLICDLRAQARVTTARRPPSVRCMAPALARCANADLTTAAPTANTVRRLHQTRIQCLSPRRRVLTSRFHPRATIRAYAVGLGQLGVRPGGRQRVELLRRGRQLRPARAARAAHRFYLCTHTRHATRAH